MKTPMKWCPCVLGLSACLAEPLQTCTPEAGGGRTSDDTGSRTPVKRASSPTLDAACKERKKCDDVFVYELSDGADESSRDIRPA